MKKKVYTVIETAQDGLSILQGAGTKSPEVLTLCLTEKTRGMDDAQISQLIFEAEEARLAAGISVAGASAPAFYPQDAVVPVAG